MSLRSLLVAAACLSLAASPPSFGDSPVSGIRWGSAGVAEGQFDTPVSIAARGDAVYVADFHNHRVQRFTPGGQFVLTFGSPGSGDGQFAGPCGVAVGPNGDVYVTDLYNNRVQRFTADGRFVAAWGGLGRAPGRFMGPYGIAVSATGEVFVTDLDNHRVQRFDGAGNWLQAWGTRGQGGSELFDPWGIAVDSQGLVYVADHGNHRIHRFTPDGAFVSAWGSHSSPDQFLLGPVGVAIGPGDAVFVTDLINHQVQKFSSDGALVTQWGTEGKNYLGALFGVAVDGDRLYVADSRTHSVLRYIDTTPGALPRGESLPGSFELAATWPNPSRGTVQLRFGLPRAGQVTATIHDLQGRLVRDLLDGAYAPGQHLAVWDGNADEGTRVSAGVYFLLCRYDDGSSTTSLKRRLVMVR